MSAPIIIARKPRSAPDIEYIVVDRGPGHTHRYVSATADTHSLSHGEWYWGYYFQTMTEAMAHFDRRSADASPS